MTGIPGALPHCQEIPLLLQHKPCFLNGHRVEGLSLPDTHCPRLPWVLDRRNLPSSFVFSSVHHRSPFGMLQIPFQSNKKTHNTLLYQKDIFRKGQINKDSHVQLFYMHFFINIRIMLYPLFLSWLFEPKWTVNGTHKSVLWHFLVHRIEKITFL